MSMDRRSFLKTTAAMGLVTLPAGRDGLALAAGADDPLGVRSEFPITREQTYINTSYVGPWPTVVQEAAQAYAREQMFTPAVGLDHSMAIKEEARRRFAEMFGASPSEIAFLFSTSDGENIVTEALDLKAGDNVVIDELHFTTTFVMYRELERLKGIELRVVPHRDGRSRLEDFEARTDGRTRLVSVAWVSNRNGFRHDLPALAELAHRHGGFLFADGIQCIGAIPTNLHAEGVDFMCANSYKYLFASWGAAPFYVREELLDRIRPDRFGHNQVAESLPDLQFRLHGTAAKYEYAGLIYGAVAQLNASLGLLGRVGLDRIEAHTVELAGVLRDGVARLGFEMFTPPQNPSAIVSFNHGRDPKEVRKVLESEKVNVSLREGGTQIRASVALFNNRADIDRLLEVLSRLA